MNLQSFGKIKKLYGSVASWAVWRDVENSDTSDLSLFDEESINSILPKLHTRFVLVALNISGPLDKPLSNFHGGRRDFMLRDAIKDTVIEGSYMTDLIKDHEDKKASSVVSYFKNNKNAFDEHIRNFQIELDAVGATRDSVLVALGSDVHRLLVSASLPYRVERLTHYSARTIGKEAYRHEVERLIARVG